jgi:hypothetical protein
MEKASPRTYLFLHVEAPEYKPYDYINSSYREHYPGQKPQMREKIVPRVKNESKSIPFNASSEYKN